VRRITLMGDIRMFDFCPASEPLGSSRAGRAAFLAEPLGSALAARAYFLLLRQKKVAKEKATPGSAPGVARSLALLGRPGGLLNSPAAQTDASRMPPAVLRCSAPLRGTRKASRNNGSAQEKTKRVFFGGRPLENGKNHFERFGGDAFPGPHVERRATELMAEKGRGLSEARRAEFRSPRQQRVAQGSRQRRPRSLGSPFLWLLSFGEAKESTPARKAEPQRKTRTTFSVSETPRKTEPLAKQVQHPT